LAHQVVHLCIHSLFSASTQLSIKRTQIDADLFLIKHLLILKEQIGAFDIEFVRPETEIDFSRVVKEFSSGHIFSPTAFARIPVVVENMLDAKEELDGKLRVAINSFTNSTAEEILNGIHGKAGADEEEEIRVLAEKFRETAEKELPSIQKKTEEYISDLRTTDILFNAVMVRRNTDFDL
jgi:conserved oligomeric Golgi complex subunit 3